MIWTRINLKLWRHWSRETRYFVLFHELRHASGIVRGCDVNDVPGPALNNFNRRVANTMKHVFRHTKRFKWFDPANLDPDVAGGPKDWENSTTMQKEK